MAKDKKSKPINFEKMIEDDIYLYKRHGYGKLYKVKADTLYFLDREDKKGYTWTPTLVDTSSAKFIPLYPDSDNFLGNLLSIGYFND